MDTDLFHTILQILGKVTETDSPTLPAFSPFFPPLPAVSSAAVSGPGGSLIFDAKARAATGGQVWEAQARPGRDRKQ